MSAGVTVVVATRDRCDRVLATLPRLTRLPCAPPVIVVDDASSDGTAQAIRAEHPAVTVIRTDRNLGAAARTLGVVAAQTPYVAFADDDSWYAPGSLAAAAGALERWPAVGLVAGSVLIEPGARPDPINAALADSPLRSPQLPGPEVLGFIACSTVVRRQAYLGVGGFEPRLLIGGEEELLALDLRTHGWRSVHVPEVVAHHAPDDADGRPGRRRLLARNRVWAAVLRRPLDRVAATVATTCVASLSDHAVRAGLFDALRGVGPMVRARRPLPRDVEHDLRRIGAAG